MKSILETREFDSNDDEITWLQGIIVNVEEWLAANRKGESHASCADVLGGLWELGLDPGND